MKLLAFLLLPLGLWGQCTVNSPVLHATGDTSTVLDNRTKGCNSFALTWAAGAGITGLSIQLEGSDSGVSYTAFTGASTVLVGTNPGTILSGAMVIQASSTLAFVRVRAVSVTGNGSVNYQLFGAAGVTPTAKGGGGAGGSCGTLGGDLSGTCAAATVVGVNGAALPSGSTVAGVNAMGQIINKAIYGQAAQDVQMSDGSGLPNFCAVYDLNGNLTNGLAGFTCLFPNVANTAGTAFTLDASASTVANAFKVPVGAGKTATANGAIAYDSTNNNLHAAQNGADAKVATYTATPGNGNCANWSVSGGLIKLGDAGAACGSSSGGGGGVLTYSGPALSVLTGTSFCPVGGGGSCSATETNVDIDSSAAATVSNMYVQLSQPLGVGNSVVVTWRDNASSTAVTCTVSGASATACNDTTHSFNVANGDLLDYQLVFSGTIVVTPTILIMSAFGTSNVGVTSVFGNTGPTVGATGDIGATGKVLGVNGVPLCTGFTPTTGQNLQYSTALSPNPCYTAATAGGAVTSVAGLTGVVPGGLVLLEQHAASSSANLAFTSWFSSTYDEYQVEMINLIPATNNVNCLLNFSINGGSTWDTGSNYIYQSYRWVYNSSAPGGVTIAGSSIVIDGTGAVDHLSNGTANGGLSGFLRIFNPGGTSAVKSIRGESTLFNSGGLYESGSTGGVYTVSASAANAFEITMSTGNIASGTVRVYGVAKQ